jgi:hypothetical protein
VRSAQRVGKIQLRKKHFSLIPCPKSLVDFRGQYVKRRVLQTVSACLGSYVCQFIFRSLKPLFCHVLSQMNYLDNFLGKIAHENFDRRPIINQDRRIERWRDLRSDRPHRPKFTLRTIRHRRKIIYNFKAVGDRRQPSIELHWKIMGVLSLNNVICY